MSLALPNRRKSIRERVFPTKLEREMDVEVGAVNEVLNRLSMKLENGEIDATYMVEGMRDIEMMIDSQGWTNAFDYDEDHGLRLGQVKDASLQLRELVAGNPFMKRGSQLRIQYVMGAGIEFSARNRTGKKDPVDIPANIQLLCEAPKNARYVFSADARAELERAAFTDGNVYLLGKDDSKQLIRVPVSQITADYRNPNNTEEIWAYRRTWNQQALGRDTSTESWKPIHRWYYTDIFDGKRKKSIKFEGNTEIIESGYTMFDKAFNRQVGWAYGVPDALCALAWSKLYKEFLVNGYVMSRALARFAYKITTSSARGGEKAAAEFTLPGQAGSSWVQGTGNEFQAMSKAGAGYDFASGRPLAEAIASGLEVSLTALLSSSGEGGSKAADSTLDAPARATGIMRRQSWDDYWVRVFRWMGLTKKLIVTWSDIPEETIQRIVQAWIGLWNTGLFPGETIQEGMARAMKIADPGEIPSGVLVPNNAASLPRKDIDADGSPAPKVNPSSGSGQGQSNPAGKSKDDHDDDES